MTVQSPPELGELGAEMIKDNCSKVKVPQNWGI